MANWLLQCLGLFHYVACRTQPLQQLIALCPVTCFQCKRFFTLHDGQTAGNTLVTYIDNVDAHLSNDGQQAHQFARTVGKKRGDEKEPRRRRRAVPSELLVTMVTDIS